MTTGEQGRTPPDAEHYLDLSGIEEDSPGPHFDVVLRGYDRRQVDEHVAGLRRMNAQLRAQLAVRERRRGAAPEVSVSSGLEGRVSDTIPEARRAPADQREAGEAIPNSPDMVGAFNDRLRGILQAAEQEAQLVRSKAAESLLAEHAESRAALAELRAQRDAVVDELVRLRGRLDDIVTGPARPSGGPPLAPQRPPAPGGPWRAAGRPLPPPHPGARPPGPYGGPPGGAYGPAGSPPSLDQPTMHPMAHPVDARATAADTDAVDAVDAGPEGPAGSDGPVVGESEVPEASEVDVTEGTHPDASAARPTPPSPERAADG